MSEALPIPVHLGLILDGNRRWAKAKGLPTLEGHRQGAEVFKDLALNAFDTGIKYVSAYIFSAENWSRSEEEVGYLMKLVIKATEQYLADFDKAGIRIVMLGRRDGLSASVLAAIERTESKTAQNKNGILALCFNYGGQEEIVDAFKRLIADGHQAEEITEELISGALYEPDIPPVDLIIRTSGEQRLSGFMLYRSAYAELLFSEKMWPDFTREDLMTAVHEYGNRQRRFGS